MSELQFGFDPETFKEDLEHTIRSILAQRNQGAAAVSDEEAADTRSQRLKRSLEALQASAARVGDQPPQPPTMRARLGAAAVRLIRRALFWYTSQIRQVHFALIEILETQSKGIEAVRERQVKEIEELRGTQVKEIGMLRDELRAVDRGHTEAERRLELLQSKFVALEAKVSRELVLLRNDVPEDLYRHFEDVFRGSREEIRARLQVYIEFVEENKLGGPEMPILDLGCGRGEWLELLRSRKLCARGADTSVVMVAQSKEAGLDVVEANLLDLLKELPDESIGMVTMFHVVEHLPVAVLLEAMRHSIRVLKPGGAVILETPNPENLRVGGHTFYTDLTHHKPIPPETLRFLAEALGLIQVQISRLNPEPEAALPSETCELERRFNRIFYGPRDYAVIARKPAPEMLFC